MSSILNHPVAQALAWALVHFVWQGAAMALVAFAVMRVGRLSASARYLTGVVAMAAMLVAPAITFARLSTVRPLPVAPLSREGAEPAAGAPGIQHLAPGTGLAPSTQHQAPSTQTVPLPSQAPTVVLILWCAGVAILSLRLLGGWFVARRMARRETAPATPEIQAMARRIAGRLALDRIVGVFESSAVSVPVMIGWVKPVVLLPAAALSGLSIGQVEALLAHELAHVRRHDYLVNLLQSVVETLLFYHPAVWWVSRRMRIDRELCCDDLALEVCDRVVYASALSDLAAMATTPRMALAATDGPLLNRVRRILGQPVDRQDSGSGWLSALLVVLLVGSIAPLALTSSQEPPRGGVAQGVVGGVLPGVAGGVPGGASTGVTAGVATGVAGGVQGGVASGVVGGVQGTVRGARPVDVARPVDLAPETIVPAEETAQADQAAVARAKKIEEERHQIELERMDNEFRHTSDQSRARIAALESDLTVQRQQFERTKQMFQKGLVDSSVVLEQQAAIGKIERAINAEKEELDYQQNSLTLKRRELALEREAQVAMGQDQVAGHVLSDRQKVELEQVVAAEKATAAERAAAATTMSPTDPVRAGDILSITLHNEPDLPTAFVVRADGTIRYPFIGEMRVLGLTARQVQETLGKQLADRKLAAGSGIDVILRRPTGR